MGRWAQKPVLPVVQGKHPLSDGLRFAWIPTQRALSAGRDMITGVPATYNNVAETDFRTGKYGVGLALDAGGDYISFTDKSIWDPAGAPGFTVAVWCSIDALGTQAEFFGKAVTGVSGNGWRLYKNSGNKLLFRCESAGVVTGATNLVAGVPLLLCGTWDGANIRCFINGERDGTAASTTVPLSSGVALRVGGIIGGADSNVGTYYGAMYWNRALGPAEMRLLYADPWGLATPPVPMFQVQAFGAPPASAPVVSTPGKQTILPHRHPTMPFPMGSFGSLGRPGR